MGCLLANIHITAQTNIVFVGNSITYGAKHVKPQKTAPPMACKRFLQSQEGFGEVFVKNCGRNGKETKDFLPRPKSYFGLVRSSARELMEAHPDGKLVFCIMLGTNDSHGKAGKPGKTPEKFGKNLRLIIDSLQANFPDAYFVLNRSPYFSAPFETKGGSQFTENSLQLLKQYLGVAKEIVKENPRVFMGDEDAYDFFEKNYKEMMFEEEGNNCTYFLHPNEQGAKQLGEYWGKALLRVTQQMK